MTSLTLATPPSSPPRTCGTPGLISLSVLAYISTYSNSAEFFHSEGGVGRREGRGGFTMTI